MRFATIALFLTVVATGWAGQSGKPSPAVATAPTAAVRAPAVFWKRDMPVPKQPVPQSERAEELPAAEPPRVAAAAPPPVVVRGPTREDMIRALAIIQTGARRAEVIAKLGPPAYSIANPDGEHLIERCRFRVGPEDLAAIEFRDGVVAAIDRLAR